MTRLVFLFFYFVFCPLFSAASFFPFLSMYRFLFAYSQSFFYVFHSFVMFRLSVDHFLFLYFRFLCLRFFSFSSGISFRFSVGLLFVRVYSSICNSDHHAPSIYKKSKRVLSFSLFFAYKYHTNFFSWLSRMHSLSISPPV